jgi:hypothetical protein
MITTADLVSVLLAASLAVPLAAWRLGYLRSAPLQFWASHPWLTAVAVSLTTPLIARGLASQSRAELLTVALPAVLAVAFLVIAVSIVHGVRVAWKRSRRRAALAAAALLLAGVLLAGVNSGTLEVFGWMVAGTYAFVAWCVLMATGAEFLARRYPE